MTTLLDRLARLENGGPCPACAGPPSVWLDVGNGPDPLPDPGRCPRCGRRLLVVLDLGGPEL